MIERIDPVSGTVGAADPGERRAVRGRRRGLVVDPCRRGGGPPSGGPPPSRSRLGYLDRFPTPRPFAIVKIVSGVAACGAGAGGGKRPSAQMVTKSLNPSRSLEL